MTATGEAPPRLATVVVLNWNGRRLLPDCLGALAEQDLDPALWEACVVDNASTDGSLELIAESYPWARAVRNDRNLGFAAGNNVAMETAATPFVVLLNNDARPEPDWLRRLLDAARAPGAEHVAAVTSKVLFDARFLPLGLDTAETRAPADPRPLGFQITRVDIDGRDVTEEALWDNLAYAPEQHGDERFLWTKPTGRLPLPFRPAPALTRDTTVRLTARSDRPKTLTVTVADRRHDVELTDSLTTHEISIPAGAELVDVINNAGSILLVGGHGADRAFQEIDTGQRDVADDVFLMSGTAVILRTEALRQIGTFDPRFFMYYEDTDLSWRLQAAGWAIRYEPTAVVRHLHSASSVEWSPFFTLHADRNRLLLLTKNAPAGLALRQVARYNLSTASMPRRTLVQAIRDHRRPALGPLALRGRVTVSFLRLLPAALFERRRLGRRLPRRQRHALLDRWMQATR